MSLPEEEFPLKARSGQVRGQDHLLKVEGVSKIFGEIKAVNDVSFELGEGSSLVVIGPSGSGKSTLLRCINWLERPTSGHIFFEGRPFGEERLADGTFKPLAGRALARQRSKMGMVFQQFNLFPHLTALGNVALGPWRTLGLRKPDAEKRALTYLEQVGLADRAKAYPNQLSGGQQQRVGIARALAMEPRLLLFDEPTSALDPELVGEVLRVIEELASRRMTMIVVTHEMTFAKEVGTHLILMDGGSIVEQGHPVQVLTTPRVERSQRFLRRLARAEGTGS